MRPEEKKASSPLLKWEVDLLFGALSVIKPLWSQWPVHVNSLSEWNGGGTVTMQTLSKGSRVCIRPRLRHGRECAAHLSPSWEESDVCQAVPLWASTSSFGYLSDIKYISLGIVNLYFYSLKMATLVSAS